MSKIANDGLTRSGITLGYSCTENRILYGSLAVPIWQSGRQRVKAERTGRAGRSGRLTTREYEGDP